MSGRAERADGPLVSVVMPARDEQEFIGEAIDSVLAQSYRPFELVVVDDGSRDRTAQIAAQRGARVVSTAGRGIAAARNRGLAIARGEYWTIFDADDVMAPDRLALQVDHLQRHSEHGIVLGLAEVFVTPGQDRPAHFNPIWDAGPYRGHPGTGLGRRATLDLVGPFDESLAIGEDIEWLARAHRAGVRRGHVDAVLLRYRIHSANTTGDVVGNRRALFQALRASLHKPVAPTADV